VETGFTQLPQHGQKVGAPLTTQQAETYQRRTAQPTMTATRHKTTPAVWVVDAVVPKLAIMFPTQRKQVQAVEPKPTVLPPMVRVLATA
jgi:hypothetical protein